MEVGRSGALDEARSDLVLSSLRSPVVLFDYMKFAAVVPLLVWLLQRLASRRASDQTAVPARTAPDPRGVP